MRAPAPFSGAKDPAPHGRGLPAGLPGKSLNDLARALKKQSKRYRKELRRCQNKFSEKAIHDSRVETRRLLSSVDLLGSLVSARHLEKAQHALKRHLDTLDDLRDTQVQLLTVGKMLRAFPAARPFHAFLLKREKRFTRKTRKHIKQICHRHLGRLIAACRADVKAHLEDRPPQRVAEVLLRSVDRAFTRTRQRWTHVRPEDPRTIHRTRVAFKKFRYMVEALADFLPGVTDDRLAAMHHYQTMMGEIQDAEVLLRTLDKFLRKQEIKPEAARRFREELLRRRQWLIRVYLRAAEQLLEFWPLPHSRVGVPPAPRGRLARESRSVIRAES
jgi:CHAD domain-containing protein